MTATIASLGLIGYLSFSTSLVLATPLSIPRSEQATFLLPLSHEPSISPFIAEHNGTIIELLNRYAPIVKLSVEEEYYPSSVEYMLPHYSFLENFHGEKHPANHTLLTPSSLDQLPLFGSGQFLSISEPHNPQPFLLSDESNYLYGPAGQKGGMKKDEKGRGKVEEPIYGFGVDMGRGIVDLWYWTFYPFNLGKSIGPFGILGNHVADWEHLRMRTVNGTPVSADFTTHNGGRFSAGTIRWEDVIKHDGRPVAYSAAGSHGIWNEPGDHIYADLAKVFRLVDVTDDDGALWDTKDLVVPVRYWDDSEHRRRLWHDGENSWLNFRGRYGNRGENDCWWHKLVGICQLVDAPPGPNRFFGITPDCIIAPLAPIYSTYNFYLSSPAIKYAEANEIGIVQVEQTCTRPKRNPDDDDDDDNSNEIDDYDEETMYDEDRLEIWTIKGLTDYKGPNKHTVTMDSCKGVQSAVRAYKISLCTIDGRCLTTSNDRKVCSYEKGKKGYKFGSAVNLEDIDDWRWTY
ncbi:hypothetical protein CI109_103468 [Kwoniella shandongensis]|uniref:Uncharacterized protein n=1 Tax=Kwoniella shandongensis TaxID=1734106 RepID=A0A5M6BWL9_9TREE|nr:uncharacterized protein CI109_004629 [Kwoniella shandongensis]KAA5527093.1 hypothetical protein CI109_004629 [Kwoniella shandongensis]